MFFRLTDCIEVQENFQLPPTVEFILVSCKSHEEIIYNNTHAIVREKPEVRRRINEAKTNNRQARPLSVLMLGIDSISRLNLIRAMPETSRHLTENGWFELQGYNKVRFHLDMFKNFPSNYFSLCLCFVRLAKTPFQI